MREQAELRLHGNHLQVAQRNGDTFTELRVRKVKRTEGARTWEETQVEITVIKDGEKRRTYGYGGLTLTPQQADIVATAVSKTIPKHEPTSYFDADLRRKEEAELREHFGLLTKKVSDLDGAAS